MDVAAAFAAIVENLASGLGLPPAGGFDSEADLAMWRAAVRVVEVLWREVSS